MCKKYPGYSNFCMYLFTKKLYILQDQESVKKVLSKSTCAQLTYINSVFFNSHGHKYGIGNIDYRPGENLWHGLHSCLIQAIDFKTIQSLMDKHKYILLGDHSFTYNMNTVLEKFIMTVWAQYTFGESCSQIDYSCIRTQLLTVLKKTFYNSHLNLIPIIGPIVASMKRIWYSKDLKAVDNSLKKLLKLNSGFMFKFRTNLGEYNKQHKIFPEEQLDAIILDNSFLSVLVFDFLYMVILEATLKIAKHQVNSPDVRLAMKQESIKNAFLFPFRFRYCPINGDYAILNLHSSQQYFSYGPRSCVGRGLFDTMYNKFFEIIQDFNLEFKNTNDIIQYSTANENIPTITSQHIVKLTMPRDYLKNNLQSSLHKGLTFYHIEKILQNPVLMQYISHQFASQINIHAIDAIVSTEARGFLFGPQIAHILKLPLYVIRKKGKLAGTVVSESYQKNYDSQETVEMAETKDLTDKNIVVVDDGVASGETLIATHSLLKKQHAKLLLVCVVVKHTYTKCKYGGEIFSLFEL